MVPRLLIFMLSLLMGAQYAHAQKPDVARPKIGLVLSGGGAKGLAHVGVLKVLEEAGIRPDFIAGTSMGAIIGGLYASGYSATDLDSIVRNADWGQLLSDKVPLKNVVPEEKRDYFRFLADFNIAHSGIRFKTGMIRGQFISEFLSQLTWRVADIDDFDSLPIPFRCVAADLISGKPYVFKNGNLAAALRASMSIPSVFTPVILDDRFLVDGGVMDNYPAKLCKEMGADFIIGVNVGFTDSHSVENLNSMYKILMATSSIGSNLMYDEAHGLTNLLIEPDLKPYTASNFYDAAKIIDLGMQQALPFLDSLKRFAQSVGADGEVKITKPLEYPKKILVKDLTVGGLVNTSYDFILSKMDIHRGDSVDVEHVNAGMRKLLGTRFIDKVTYELEKVDDGHVIHLKVLESHSTKTAFSINYDNTYGVGLVINLTLRNMVVKNTRLSLTGQASKSPQINADIFNYIGSQMNFGTGLEAGYTHSILPFYRAHNGLYGSLSYRYSYAGFKLNYSARSTLLFAPELFTDRHVLLSESGFSNLFDNGINKFGFRQAKLIFPVTINSLNNRYQPTRGLKIEVVGTANFFTKEIYSGYHSSKSLVDQFFSGYDKQYLALQAFAVKPVRFNKNLILTAAASGTYFLNRPPLAALSFAGGSSQTQRLRDLPFVGLHYRELLVKDYWYSSIDLCYIIDNTFSVSLLTNGLYKLSIPNRFVPTTVSLSNEKLWIGGGIALTANTFLGPVQFGVGTNSNDRRARFYFSVGLPF